MNNAGTAKIAFTTITGNRLEGLDGYAYNGRRSAGIYNQSLVIVGNRIIEGNHSSTLTVPETAGSDCKNESGTGEFSTAGYNVIGTFEQCEDGSSEVKPGARRHDKLGEDAHLDDLADNGGLTRTHELLEGSPAIDHGLDPRAPGSFDVGDVFFACPRGDQRGRLRPGVGTPVCDAGAYEACRASQLECALAEQFDPPVVGPS